MATALTAASTMDGTAGTAVPAVAARPGRAPDRPSAPDGRPGTVTPLHRRRPGDLVAEALRRSGLHGPERAPRRPRGPTDGDLVGGALRASGLAPTRPRLRPSADLVGRALRTSGLAPSRPRLRPSADLVGGALRASGLAPTRPRRDETATPPARHPAARPVHLPALDGLRGVAIAMVVAFHFRAPWAPGGFVGVDVFFVLSGYLITGLLVQEHRTAGGVDLRHFWGRRARRLLPALCLLLVVLAGVSWADPRLVSPTALRTDGLATLLYVQNWHLALQSHTAQVAQIFAPSPLLHTWSLAIEEQFYLVWPLVVLVALRRRRGRVARRRVLWAVVLGGALASAGAMAAMSVAGSAPLPIYYDSGTRAFELLVGAGLALLLPMPTGGTATATASGRAVRAGEPPARRPVGGWAAEAAGALALVGIVAFAVLVPGLGATWIFRGGLVAAAVAAAVVVAAVVRAPRSAVGRLLASPPAVALGRISYGVYLWHWPVLVLVTSGTTGLHGAPLVVLQLGLTLLAALASWVLVERPFRRLPAASVLPRLAVPAGCAAAACLLVGALAARPPTP